MGREWFVLLVHKRVLEEVVRVDKALEIWGCSSYPVLAIRDYFV
jgi:hypothetical protein